MSFGRRDNILAKLCTKLQATATLNCYCLEAKVEQSKSLTRDEKARVRCIYKLYLYENIPISAFSRYAN